MDTSKIRQRIRAKDSGSEVTLSKALGRISRICSAITDGFPSVKDPSQIQLKHLLYIRDHWYAASGFSEATICDYRRAMRLMVFSLGREKDWLKPLKLAQDPTKGGRPTATRVTQSKARHRRGVQSSSKTKHPKGGIN